MSDLGYIALRHLRGAATLGGDLCPITWQMIEYFGAEKKMRRIWSSLETKPTYLASNSGHTENTGVAMSMEEMKNLDRIRRRSLIEGFFDGLSCAANFVAGGNARPLRYRAYSVDDAWKEVGNYLGAGLDEYGRRQKGSESDR
jgi:hypothetical protein